MDSYKNFNDLVALAKTLAPSQGFYGRLLEQLSYVTEEGHNIITEEMKKQGLKTDVDIILWLEG